MKLFIEGLTELIPGSISRSTINLCMCLCIALIGTSSESTCAAVPQDKAVIGKKANEQSVDSDPFTTTVGFPKTILQVKFPGSELAPKPNTDRKDPIVLRVVQSYKHGSDYRYDLEYIGLDPGAYDLANYLVRKDESVIGQLPELRVQVNTLLPAGRVEPNQLSTQSNGFSSYYLPTLIVLGALWLAGLFAILFSGWSKTRKVDAKQVTVSFADKIKPLVEKAKTGELEPQGQAELERLLSNYWQSKLRLKHLTAHQLRQSLRQHPEASVMLGQLDKWLYDPGSNDDVDVAKLLQPYQNAVDAEHDLTATN